MANINDIQNGDSGFSARTKINAAIAEANGVDDKVEQGTVGAESVTTATGAQTVVQALDQRGPVFDNVADVKAASGLAVGIKCRTLGYYAPGDGGGNDYEIVASGTGTDDGGSFIDLSGSGLQAKGLFHNKVSTLQFGGTTSQNIEAACKYASDSGITSVDLGGEDVSLDSAVNFYSRDITGSGITLSPNGHAMTDIGSLYGVKQYDGSIDRDLMRPLAPSATAIPTGNKKLVFENSGRIYVLTQGGASNAGLLTRLVTGNVADPSLPSSSLNENWETWRPASVYSVQNAYAYRLIPDSTTGTWEDFTATQSAMSDETPFFPTESKRSRTVGNTITYDINVGASCRVDIAFLGTATSGNAGVSINGSSQETVTVTSASASLTIRRFDAVRGANTVEIEHLSGNNLYVIGPNFSDLSGLEEERDYDYVATYHNSPIYISNQNAHDYAFKDTIDDLWGGSYHGGETKIVEPEFSLNGKLIDPTVSGFTACGRAFNIFQRTKVTWSTQELELNNSIIFGDSSYQQAVTCVGEIQALTFHPGMSGTSDSFETLLSSVYIDDVTLQTGSQRTGNSLRVEQINRATGRRVISEFTPLTTINSPDYGGGTVAYADGAGYNKIYYSPIRNTDQKIVNPAWVFTRTFN